MNFGLCGCGGFWNVRRCLGLLNYGAGGWRHAESTLAGSQKSCGCQRDPAQSFATGNFLFIRFLLIYDFLLLLLNIQFSLTQPLHHFRVTMVKETTGFVSKVAIAATSSALNVKIKDTDVFQHSFFAGGLARR